MTIVAIEPKGTFDSKASNGVGSRSTMGTSTEVPSRDFDRLAIQLVELEKQYPPPNEQEQLDDCRWFQQHSTSSVLAGYRGTHVAIYQGQVVGSGDNSLQLNIDLARQLGVHPQRLVIEYLPRPSVF